MTEQKTSSRRALMKGVAWAAPVAAVAVAAPAYALSYPVVIEFDEDKSCKASSSDKYYLYFKLTNQSTGTINYQVTSLTVTASSGQSVTFPQLGSGTLAPGASFEGGFCSNEAKNMASGTARIEVRVTGGGGTPVVVPVEFDIPELNPCEPARPCR